MTFAIDRIPSLVDAIPYSSYTLLEEGQSDGVPELLGEDNTVCSRPPRGSVSLAEIDGTVPMRHR